MKPKRRSREEWLHLVTEWRRSGLELRAFADSRGVPAARLELWSGIFAREDESSAPPVGGVESALTFVDVTPAAPDGPPLPPSSSRQFDLTLAGGRMISFDPGVDLAALLTLVRALEAAR